MFENDWIFEGILAFYKIFVNIYLLIVFTHFVIKYW